MVGQTVTPWAKTCALRERYDTMLHTYLRSTQKDCHRNVKVEMLGLKAESRSPDADKDSNNRAITMPFLVSALLDTLFG